jgi:hypothetical protein
MSTLSRRSLSATVFWSFAISAFGAPLVTVTDPNVRFSDSRAACTDRTGAINLGGPCTSTAYLSLMPASLVTPYISPGTFNTPPQPNALLDDFQQAFNNWNAALPLAQQWTIRNGGALDLTFQVSTFEAQARDPNASAIVGGLDITITAANYAGKLADGSAGPAANTLAWSQGLYVNFRPGVAATTVQDILDNFTFNMMGAAFAGGCTPLPASPMGGVSTIPPNPPKPYCDPIYPFQNAPGGAGQPNGFGDAPRTFWDRPGSFRGIALLSTVDTNNRILTVYNGVSYGFDLSTPEPSTVVLFLAGMGWILFARYRKKVVTVTGVSSRRNPEPSPNIPRRVDNGDCHQFF